MVRVRLSLYVVILLSVYPLQRLYCLCISTWIPLVHNRHTTGASLGQVSTKTDNEVSVLKIGTNSNDTAVWFIYTRMRIIENKRLCQEMSLRTKYIGYAQHFHSFNAWYVSICVPVSVKRNGRLLVSCWSLHSQQLQNKNRNITLKSDEISNSFLILSVVCYHKSYIFYVFSFIAKVRLMFIRNQTTTTYKWRSSCFRNLYKLLDKKHNDRHWNTRE